jgi:hypothetical protein
VKKDITAHIPRIQPADIHINDIYGVFTPTESYRGLMEHSGYDLNVSTPEFNFRYSYGFDSGSVRLASLVNRTTGEDLYANAVEYLRFVFNPEDTTLVRWNIYGGSIRFYFNVWQIAVTYEGAPYDPLLYMEPGAINTRNVIAANLGSDIEDTHINHLDFVYGDPFWIVDGFQFSMSTPLFDVVCNYHIVPWSQSGNWETGTVELLSLKNANGVDLYANAVAELIKIANPDTYGLDSWLAGPDKNIVFSFRLSDGTTFGVTVNAAGIASAEDQRLADAIAGMRNSVAGMMGMPVENVLTSGTELAEIAHYLQSEDPAQNERMEYRYYGSMLTLSESGEISVGVNHRIMYNRLPGQTTPSDDVNDGTWGVPVTVSEVLSVSMDGGPDLYAIAIEYLVGLHFGNIYLQSWEVVDGAVEFKFGAQPWWKVRVDAVTGAPEMVRLAMYAEAEAKLMEMANPDQGAFSLVLDCRMDETLERVVFRISGLDNIYMTYWDDGDTHFSGNLGTAYSARQAIQLAMGLPDIQMIHINYLGNAQNPETGAEEAVMRARVDGIAGLEIEVRNTAGGMVLSAARMNDIDLYANAADYMKDIFNPERFTLADWGIGAGGTLTFTFTLPDGHSQTVIVDPKSGKTYMGDIGLEQALVKVREEAAARLGLTLDQVHVNHGIVSYISMPPMPAPMPDGSLPDDYVPEAIDYGHIITVSAGNLYVTFDYNGPTGRITLNNVVSRDNPDVDLYAESMSFLAEIFNPNGYSMFDWAVTYDIVEYPGLASMDDPLFRVTIGLQNGFNFNIYVNSATGEPYFHDQVLKDLALKVRGEAAGKLGADLNQAHIDGVIESYYPGTMGIPEMPVPPDSYWFEVTCRGYSLRYICDRANGFSPRLTELIKRGNPDVDLYAKAIAHLRKVFNPDSLSLDSFGMDNMGNVRFDFALQDGSKFRVSVNPSTGEPVVTKNRDIEVAVLAARQKVAADTGFALDAVRVNVMPAIGALPEPSVASQSLFRVKVAYGNLDIAIDCVLEALMQLTAWMPRSPGTPDGPIHGSDFGVVSTTIVAVVNRDTGVDMYASALASLVKQYGRGVGYTVAGLKLADRWASFEFRLTKDGSLVTIAVNSEGKRTAYEVIKMNPGDPGLKVSIDSYAYDTRTGYTLTYKRTDFDASGVNKGSSEYVYSRDDAGRNISYIRTDTDGAGNFKAGYVYSDFVYDAAGRALAYMRTDVDASGATLRSYAYAGMKYDSAGRTLSYTRIDKDATGNVTYVVDIGYAYDASGARTAYSEAAKNLSNPSILKSLAEYAYDPKTGYNTTYRTTSFDASGIKTKSSLYEYTRDAKGTILSYVRIDSDASGNVIARSLIEYRYDASGVRTGYIETGLNPQSGLKLFTNDYTYYPGTTYTKTYIRTDFDASGVKAKVSAYEYTRDAKGAVLSYMSTVTDASGNATARSLVEYRYDASGVRTGYLETGFNPQNGLDLFKNDYTYYPGTTYTKTYIRTDFDASGNVKLVSAYEYNKDLTNGRNISYTRVDTDASGAKLRSYAYSDMKYDSAGRTLSYTRTDADVSGKVTNILDIAFEYDASGAKTLYSETYRNPSDASLVKYISSYTYDPKTGYNTTYTRTDFDASGVKTGSSDYVYMRDPSNGKALSYVRTDRNAAGNVSNVYEVKYSYDDNSNPLRVTLAETYKNSIGDGHILYSNFYRYDADGKQYLDAQVSHRNGDRYDIYSITYYEYIKGSAVADMAAYYRSDGSMTIQRIRDYDYSGGAQRWIDFNISAVDPDTGRQNITSTVTDRGEATGYYYDAMSGQDLASNTKDKSGKLLYQYSYEHGADGSSLTKTTVKNGAGDTMFEFEGLLDITKFVLNGVKESGIQKVDVQVGGERAEFNQRQDTLNLKGTGQTYGMKTKSETLDMIGQKPPQ